MHDKIEPDPSEKKPGSSEKALQKRLELQTLEHQTRLAMQAKPYERSDSRCQRSARKRGVRRVWAGR